MTKLTYNSCLIYRYELFDIVALQINDIVMLANNTFAAIEEKANKTAKFIIKKQVCFLLQTYIKFNCILIQPMPNGDITSSHKTRVRGISLIKDYKAFTISFREVMHNNLF